MNAHFYIVYETVTEMAELKNMLIFIMILKFRKCISGLCIGLLNVYQLYISPVLRARTCKVIENFKDIFKDNSAALLQFSRSKSSHKKYSFTPFTPKGIRKFKYHIFQGLKSGFPALFKTFLFF